MGINDVEKVAYEINKCYFVFSSSLHGIIFSHSLVCSSNSYRKNKVGF